MPEAKARVLQHRRVYEGRVISLDVDEVSEPGGVKGTREVVRQSGSVAALPVFDDGRIVLVRQYRYAVSEYVWELPAGRRDPHEAPEAGGKIPAIALSAYARSADRDRALAAGFGDYVVKPVEPSRLVEVVAASVSRHD